MSSSPRGPVLAGRYRLEERIHTSPDGALWRATDSTLDRRVSVRVMRPGHPFRADVADAARRAALIDDPRLVRVLDVGADGDVGFVVSEYLDGDSLATMVERSPLPAPLARRIVGEVAQGLEIAAARGLHHLRLTPRSVIVSRSGTVKISGTAVEAAAAGMEPSHAASANRVDAVALVALLYSGLTGRWPLGDAGFPPAPRGEGGAPVPPADLVPGVPNDLDTLCVVTLGPHDDGPQTPGELAQQLSPWPSAEDAPGRPVPRRTPIHGVPVMPNPALTIRGRGGATPPPAFTAPTAGTAPTSAAAQTPAAAQTRAVAQAQAAQAERAARGIPARPPARPGAAPTAAPVPSLSLFTPSNPSAGPSYPGNARPIPPTTGPGSDSAARGTARNAGGSAGNAGGTAGSAGSDGNWGSNGHGGRREPLVPWSQGPSGPSRLESTGPFPIVIPAEAPPQEQSRQVIFAVTGALVVLLLIAAFSLRNFGGSGAPNKSPIPTVTSAANKTTTPSTSPAPTAASTAPTVSPTATAPLRIAKIMSLDPQGDGDENTATSPLAVDGDPSTFWKSNTYYTANFSGLKHGVGLSLKLKKPTSVQSATIHIDGVGGTVQLRTANQPSFASSTLAGQGSFKNGKVTVRADITARSKYVILWFTKLPSVEGKYKLQVSEVQLK